MAVIVRFECDFPRCESYVATDVLHREGPEHLFDASAKRDGADGLVGLEVELRLEGWFCGDAGMGNDLRVLCPRHGAVCPQCNGGGFLRRTDLPQPRISPPVSVPCPRCETFGVVVVDEATAATLAWLSGSGRPTDYEEQLRALGIDPPPLPEPPPDPRVAAELAPLLAAIDVPARPCPHADHGAVYGCCPLLIVGVGDCSDPQLPVCADCPEREAVIAMVNESGRSWR